MQKINKPKSKTQRMQDFASEVAEHLIELSKEHEYPLTRPNWKGLMDEITRQLTPHYPMAEELARVETAKKMGIDLAAMEERMIAWRKQSDLVTPQEVAERHGLLLDEVIEGQALDYLNFVPIPDEVIQAPDRYRNKNDHWNYPRAEMEALTREQILAMSAAATMTVGKIADYLRVDFQQARHLVEGHLAPCGAVKSPVGHGKPLYRILDVRRLEKYLMEHETIWLDECRRMRQAKEERPETSNRI